MGKSIKQNITLSLPKTLLRKAKIAATKMDKSLSEYIREALESRMQEIPAYKNARKRQLALLDQGFDFGTQGELDFQREELYER